MKEDKLSDLSMQLSVDVLNLVKELRNKKENIISNQIGRSATSVCANIAESKYGHSRADFIAKLEIALKEASETGKWLEMLYKTDYIDEATYKANTTCFGFNVGGGFQYDINDSWATFTEMKGQIVSQHGSRFVWAIGGSYKF